MAQSSPRHGISSTPITESPRVTPQGRWYKGFRPKLWTAQQAGSSETFSVWPCVSESLDCGSSVRVCIDSAQHGFASESACGESLVGLDAREGLGSNSVLLRLENPARVTFHNAESGFCVLKVQARGKRDFVTS